MFLEINFTVVVFSISFLVFIYLLNLTLYKPVGEIIEKRKNLIHLDFYSAKECSKEANEILDSYTKDIKNARISAMKTVEEVIEKANNKKKEKINEVIETILKDKNEAINKIKKEEEISMRELEQKISLLSELITNKLLGKGNLVGTR